MKGRDVLMVSDLSWEARDTGDSPQTFQADATPTLPLVSPPAASFPGWGDHWSNQGFHVLSLKLLLSGLLTCLYGIIANMEWNFIIFYHSGRLSSSVTRFFLKEKTRREEL